MTDGAGAGTGPAGPPRMSRLDLAVLVLAWCALVPDLLLGVLSTDQVVIAVISGGLMLILVDVLVLGGTAVLVRSVVRTGSPTRWLHGRVPGYYHAIVLAWFGLVVAAPLLTGFEGLALGQGFTGWRESGLDGEATVAIDPAITGAVYLLSLLARVATPVALLVLRTDDVRRVRRILTAPRPTPAGAEPGMPGPGASGPGTWAAGLGTWAAGSCPPGPGTWVPGAGLPGPGAWAPPVHVPHLVDTLLLVLVWCAPIASLGMKLTHLGLGLVLVLVASPVLLAVVVHALWVFTAVLGGRSRVRARFGQVPVLYRVMAVVWVIAVLLPGAAVVEVGWVCRDDCSWQPGSVLEEVLGRPLPFELVLVLVVGGLLAAAGAQVLVDLFRRADAPAPRRGRRGGPWPATAAPAPVPGVAPVVSASPAQWHPDPSSEPPAGADTGPT